MRDILSKMKVADLKKEISKTNIKGYSKMKKSELIDLMVKNKEKFSHLSKGAPAPKVEPAKAKPAKAKRAKKPPLKKSQVVEKPKAKQEKDKIKFHQERLKKFEEERDRVWNMYNESVKQERKKLIEGNFKISELRKMTDYKGKSKEDLIYEISHEKARPQWNKVEPLREKVTKEKIALQQEMKRVEMAKKKERIKKVEEAKSKPRLKYGAERQKYLFEVRKILDKIAAAKSRFESTKVEELEDELLEVDEKFIDVIGISEFD